MSMPIMGKRSSVATGSWSFVATSSSPPSGVLASQPHPDPWMPASSALYAARNFSSEPYFRSMAAMRVGAVLGLAEEEEAGHRFCQNSEWLMWPPPLNLLQQGG